MREILFRGKRKDNEWVEGYLVKKVDPIYTDIKSYFILYQEMDHCGCLMSFMSWDKIIPETVGQYTGLTDKNGNRIFEGDIILYRGKKGIVHFNTSIGVPCFTTGVGGGSSTALHPYKISKQHEVVGNIYDNPELLNGIDKCVLNNVGQFVLQSATPENFEPMNG